MRARARAGSLTGNHPKGADGARHGGPTPATIYGKLPVKPLTEALQAQSIARETASNQANYGGNQKRSGSG